jgi:hypothetical protein
MGMVWPSVQPFQRHSFFCRKIKGGPFEQDWPIARFYGNLLLGSPSLIEAVMNQTNIILLFMLLCLLVAIALYDKGDSTPAGAVVTTGGSPAAREVKSIGVSRYDRATIDLSRRIIDPAYTLEKTNYEDALMQLYRLGGAVQEERLSLADADNAVVALDNLMRDGFFSEEDSREWAIHVSSLLVGK